MALLAQGVALLEVAGDPFWRSPPIPQRTAPIGFYRHATDSGQIPSPERSAAHCRLITLAGTWKAADVAPIKAANPDCRVLCYLNASRCGLPDARGDYNSVVSLPEAHAHGWDSGVADGDAGGHIAQPTDPAGYAELAADRTVQRLAGTGFDGVFLDDCNSHSPDVQGGTGDATVWDSWMERVNESLGAALRSAGLVTVANLSGCIGQRNLESGGWEERQFDHFDYGFDEFFLTWPSGEYMAEPFVDEAFRLMRDKGGRYIAHSTVLAADRAEIDVGLAAALIAGCEFSVQPDSGQEPSWAVAAYARARALGAPTGAAVEDGGAWTRPFEHGTATLSPASKSATIG